jgi:transcriptional regulator with XRE-family HTH domain
MNKIEQLIAIRDSAGLTTAELCKLLDVRDTTMTRWMSGEKEIPDSVMDEAVGIEQDVHWVLGLIKEDPVWANMPYRFLKAAQYLLDKETTNS